MADVDIDKLKKALRGLVQTIYEECSMGEVYYEGEFEQDIQNVIDAFKTVEEREADLKKYLLSHEEDIADSINDFGELTNMFIGIFDRKPKSPFKDALPRVGWKTYKLGETLKSTDYE